MAAIAFLQNFRKVVSIVLFMCSVSKMKRSIDSYLVVLRLLGDPETTWRYSEQKRFWGFCGIRSSLSKDLQSLKLVAMLTRYQEEKE